MLAERSSLVGRFASIHEVGERGPEEKNISHVLPNHSVLQKPNSNARDIHPTSNGWVNSTQFDVLVLWVSSAKSIKLIELAHPSLKQHSKLLTPGNLIPQSPHFGAVPAFLM